MKKINIFNRNTNLPSYRRMPVSRGFNRGGGIPLFSGMTAVIFALFIATPSFATPTELDKKTVASKAYVDTKQDIIETGLVNYYSGADDETKQVPSLVSYDSTNGLKGNQIGILDFENTDNDGFLGLIGSEMDNFVPTVRAVAEALQSIWDNMLTLTWNNTQSTAINAYNSTFGNGTNQWAGSGADLINGQFLANSLALKQNKIPATDDDYGLYNVLTDSDTDGEVGKLRILTEEYMQDHEESFDSWEPGDGEMVTGGAIYRELRNNWQRKIPAGTTPNGLYTSGSVLTYTNSAGTVGEKYIIDRQKWDELTSGMATWTDDYVDMLVNAGDIDTALKRKQNKLPAKSTGNAAPKGNQAVVLNTAGNPLDVYTTAGKDLALTAKSGAQRVMNYIDGTTASATFATSQGLTEAQVKSALVSLELLKDVYSELNAKITNNALPTGTAGTVVTYNGTNQQTGVQEFGERAVYDPANAYNAQNDATKLATAGFVETKQNKMTCAGWDSDTHTDEHCWLWSIE